MKNKVITIFLIIITLTSLLFACSADLKICIDYAKNNDFEVEVIDNDEALTFAPKDKEYKYGLIFYVGTFLSPKSYQNIANMLASQGILVVIPKIKNNLSYGNYNNTEQAFNNYPDVSFFVGGHSQGGGAAIKRAFEEQDRIMGVVLYSPLAYSTDTLIDTDMPVLFIEASNDKVLTPDMKQDTKSRVTEGATFIMIEGGNHMGYCDILFPFDGKMEISKEDMQVTVAEYTINFIKEVIIGDINQ